MKKILYLTIPLFIFLACQSENDEDLNPENPGDSTNMGDIIAYYMLNGNALDSSGNGNDGMLYGNPLVTEDRYGNPGSALYFNGNDDYMLAEIGNHDPISVSLWFAHKNNEMGKAYVIFDYGDNAFRGEVDMTSGATKTYGYYNDTAVIEMQSPKMIWDNDIIWHHLYIDSGSDTTNPRLYIDGNLEGMLDERQVLNVATNLVYFGRPFTGTYTSAAYFDGKLDDIKIYKRVLSEEEILSLFDNYIVGYY
jgi:hypothetical protein